MKLTEQQMALYLGCEIAFADNNYEPEGHKLTAHTLNIHKTLPNFKLLLRPLSSMTEEEMKEFATIEIFQTASQISSCEKHGDTIYFFTDDMASAAGAQSLNRCSSFQFAYLLSKQFDLFSLIEIGLANRKEIEP